MLAGRKSTRGRGGMATKIQAARIAMNSGGIAVIANGLKPGILARVLNGEVEGTLFVGKAESLSGKRRWIAFASSVVRRTISNAKSKSERRWGGAELNSWANAAGASGCCNRSSSALVPPVSGIPSIHLFKKVLVRTILSGNT